MLTVEKTKLDFEISIEITIAVIAFLLSISTNFIDKKIYNNAILFLALISLTIHCLKKKQLKIRSKTIYLAILVTIIIGYNFLIAQVAAKKLLIYLSNFLIGFILCDIKSDNDRNNALNRILYLYMIILLITAVFGFLESFIGNIFDQYTVRVYGNTDRLHSVFLHAIIFSLMMLQAFVLVHYMVVDLITKAILEFITVYCIIFSMTRSAWIVFFVIIFLSIVSKTTINGKNTIVQKKTTVRKQILDFIIILAFLLLIIWQFDIQSYIVKIFSRWEALAQSMSVKYRLKTSFVLIDGMSKRNFLQWIFGSGQSSEEIYLAKHGVFLESVGRNVVDNQWICIAFDFGLIGCLFLLYFLINAFKSLFIKSNSMEMKALSLCILCNIFMAFTCDIFKWNTAGGLVFILFGLMSSNLKFIKNKNIPSGILTKL